MSFVIPDKHKIDLRAALTDQGWSVDSAEPATDAWWMNELWLITSQWRPVGVTLYVSFLGDPMDDHRPPRRVGDVGVGREPAENRFGRNVDCFALHPNWPKNLERIIACLTHLRNETWD